MTGQTDFTRAMLDPALATPEGVINPDGAPASKRFDVYRNNVTTSLAQALETAFPVIRKLVGDANFKILARTYLRQHPPSSPLMMFYGEDMPDFLAGFAPVQSIGYLPDVARLELALRHAYHAADATPISADALQQLPPDRLMTTRLHLAPAVRLIRSPWPIHAIWAFNMADGPKPSAGAQDVLITRAEFDPLPVALPAGGGDFVAALLDGAPFGTALETAGADFDLTTTLGLLLGGGAITKLEDTQ